MIGAIYKQANKIDRVQRAADRGLVRGLFRRAASLRKHTVASIDRSKEPSQPGQPIHTRRGLARRAYRFHVDRQQLEAVVGPRGSVVGDVMQTMEQGGERFGTYIEARPTIGPQLEENAKKYPGDFAGSIGA